MTLTLKETLQRLQTTDFEALPKPRKNKGVRGQLLELALGIPNSSKLTDLVDGELKSYTKGESVAVTQLRHTLPEILDFTSYKYFSSKFDGFVSTKLGQKLYNTIYVAFDRNNNYLGTKVYEGNNKLIESDYWDICYYISETYEERKTLHTYTGRNGILQIRTKDSKDKNGNYHPIKWKGHQLSDKGFAFYLTGRYAKTIV